MEKAEDQIYQIPEIAKKLDEIILHKITRNLRSPGNKAQRKNKQNGTKDKINQRKDKNENQSQTSSEFE